MFKRMMVHICTIGIVVFSITFVVSAEKVGVFFDSGVAQIKFAADDVKAALESKNFAVEMLPLSSLNASYNNKKQH